MPATISRSATRKIAALRDSHTICVVRALRDNFERKMVAADAAWADLAKFRSARLTDHGDHVRVTVHGNLWYELRPGT